MAELLLAAAEGSAEIEAATQQIERAPFFKPEGAAGGLRDEGELIWVFCAFCQFAGEGRKAFVVPLGLSRF